MHEHAVRLWETRDLQRQGDARSPKQSLGGQGICLITRPNLPVGTIPPEGEREDCSTAFAVAGWWAGRDIPSDAPGCWRSLGPAQAASPSRDDGGQFVTCASE